MSDFVEYKPMDVEHNVKAAVENLRKAYLSNDTKKVAKIFTEAEGIIVSAICHDNYTIGKPVDTSGDLISRNDALKAVDTRHEELLHDTEYRRKHCQIDLLGIKKHILAIPSANILKPSHDDSISREVINSEIEKRYCSKHCVVPSEEPYCPDNCPARFLKNIVKECPSVPEKPQGECCGSCYLCDAGDCGADMRKAEE